MCTDRPVLHYLRICCTFFCIYLFHDVIKLLFVYLLSVITLKKYYCSSFFCHLNCYATNRCRSNCTKFGKFLKYFLIFFLSWIVDLCFISDKFYQKTDSTILLPILSIDSIYFVYLLALSVIFNTKTRLSLIFLLFSFEIKE